MTNHLQTFAEYPIQYVLPYSGSNAENKEYESDFGYKYPVKMKSLRYQCFAKSLKCWNCDIEGNIFLLQGFSGSLLPSAHFNLYCRINGNIILMNKDHIHPVSAGGSDDINNLRTSCEFCNSMKCSVSDKVFNQVMSFINFGNTNLNISIAERDKIVKRILKVDKFRYFVTGKSLIALTSEETTSNIVAHKRYLRGTEATKQLWQNF